MYYVNKIVTWVMSPMGLLFLELGSAWLLGRIHRGCWARLGRWIVGLTLAFVWVMGCGVTTRLIGLPLEVDEVDEGALPSADAIILLGGGMGVHEVCGRAEMFAGADRVWMAARLYKAGAAPVVFVTGTNNVFSTTGLLVDFGVPTNALRYVDAARNTEEEAKEIAEVLSPSRIGVGLIHRSTSDFDSAKPKILLVTSAWHMPRAKMLFERSGLQVTPAPTDYEMHFAAERSLEFGDFFPGAEALVRNSCAVKEWVAYFGYLFLRR